MEENKLGALSQAPNSEDTENRAGSYSNYTANAGARHIARLIAGEHVPDAVNLVEPWNGLAREIIARRNGRSAVEIFEELIASRDDANEIRAEVLSAPLAEDEDEFKAETKAQELSMLTDVPELPASARYPEKLVRGIDGIGGWLGAYMDFACQAAPMSPRLFHLILGLALLATAIARRVFLRVSNTSLYSNFYGLIVAHSTLYAKTTALDLARYILEQAGLERFMLPVGITPQSLISELTGRQPDTFASWELNDQEDWRRERPFAAQRVWLIDEAAALLEAFDQKYTSDLLNQVLRLFDCPKKLTAASTIIRGRQTIHNAYLTICGSTTPSAMRVHINNRAYWGNGLFARVGFITPDVPPWRVFYPPQVETPHGLISSLHDLALEILPQPQETGLGEIQNAAALQAALARGVWESWDAYHSGLWELMRQKLVLEKFYANYGRFHALAMKIALLLATTDWANASHTGTVTVTMEHWAKAQVITEAMRASLHRMIADAGRASEDDDLEAKTIRVLRQKPAGLSTRELAIALSMTDSNRRDLVDRLVERMRRDGLIDLVERKGARGPAAQAWILMGGGLPGRFKSDKT